jgi:ribosome-dependent ATPase
MFVIGYGISMDVENLRYAVLDRDQTRLSQNYALNLSGSRYFIERPPIVDTPTWTGACAAASCRWPSRSRRASAATCCAGGRCRSAPGSTAPCPARRDRARLCAGHAPAVAGQSCASAASRPQAASSVETRFRYNPDVKSLPAMVPAVIPLLLLMLPAMLTALAVVREKELGSIINLYVTPVTRTEFLLGKQLPYVGLAMVNFPADVRRWRSPCSACPSRAASGRWRWRRLRLRHVATGMGLLASTVTAARARPCSSPWSAR